MRLYTRFIMISVASALFLSSPSHAQRPIVYPAKGQSVQTIVLDQIDGNMSVALANRDGVVVIFGTCTPLEKAWRDNIRLSAPKTRFVV